MILVGTSPPQFSEWDKPSILHPQYRTGILIFRSLISEPATRCDYEIYGKFHSNCHQNAERALCSRKRTTDQQINTLRQCESHHPTILLHSLRRSRTHSSVYQNPTTFFAASALPVELAVRFAYGTRGDISLRLSM